jgi:hypothetical protein
VRHHRQMKKNRLILIAGLLAFTSGCNTPKHSNVLIFATNTKVAFDISYDPKIQQPNITLGFSRQEGVWMPLLANYGPDGLEPGPLTITTTPPPAIVSQIAPPLYQGNEGNDRDTYSVIATFKGRGAAKGSGTSGTEASGSIAQFFATGLAARELARQGGAALVSTKSPPPDDGQTVAKYILDPNYQPIIDKLNVLRKKKLTSEQTIGAKTYTTGSSAAIYADALAADSGDTLFDIETQPERASDLQIIISQLQDATK